MNRSDLTIVTNDIERHLAEIVKMLREILVELKKLTKYPTDDIHK